MRAAWLGLAAAAVVAACGGGGRVIDSGAGLHEGDPPPDAKVGPTATVHLLGRFTAEAQPRFEWPGSTIVVRTSGGQVDVRLDDSGNNRFDVAIDGAFAKTIAPAAGMGTYTVASGLAPGEHEVAIARRTESFFGATTLVGVDGTLVPSPGPGRWIELVGDSITCGYGVLGPDQSSCFSNDTEAETHGWAALTAAALGAAHTSIAYSGKGVVRNGGGDTVDLMPVLYERTLADDAGAWEFTAYAPDVVVVDLGTNDFAKGDPGQAFVTGYTALLAQIRGHHADAWIVVAQSPMLSDGYPVGAMQRTKAAAYFAAAIDARHAAGDSRVVYADIAEQLAADQYGCDYHPSATTQQKMATQLAAKIREITGW